MIVGWGGYQQDDRGMGRGVNKMIEGGGGVNKKEKTLTACIGRE